MAKSKRHKKRRKKINRRTVVRKTEGKKNLGWDNNGGYSKSDGKGFVYYYTKHHKLMKIDKPTPDEQLQQKLVEASVAALPEPEEKYDTWLFICPLDESIALPISNLPEDTPKHCETTLKNSECPFLAEGCVGCLSPEHKQLFKGGLLNAVIGGYRDKARK